jgi:hypothetical protein
MYFTSKFNQFYKIMALSVVKKGGVTIPKRPHFYPTLEEYKNTESQMLLNEILNKLTDYFNSDKL